jgi:catechol 2,3-dioxygenase-like lactoylglutathione lyase family enzyme
MPRTRTTKPARPLKRTSNHLRSSLSANGAARAIGQDMINDVPQLPHYQEVIPTLRITDYRLSRAFYTALLGFRVDWEHCYDPETAVFMQISRAGMLIFLTQHEGDCQVGGLVHFFVPDVDALHAELCRRGTPVKESPHMGIEGHRMMTLVDPDGNQLRICTRSTK